MKYYFPLHLDAGNRGCEGIAKGTALLLKEEKSKLVGLCTDVCLDKKMQIDKYVTLSKAKEMTFVDIVRKKIFYKIVKNKESRKAYNYHFIYDSFLNQMTKDDILISTGGDMMCYGNNEVIYTTNKAHKRGIKTVLWGCSMGEENLTKEKEKTLRQFDLIYTRESITYNFLVKLGLKKVVCFPDPAFVLMPEEVLLPDVFSKGSVLGLNISNFVLGGFDLDNPFGCQITRFMDYVFNETDLNIMLIPHVTWQGQDDRIIANLLYNRYNSTQRISVLNIDDLNYCQIRYIISKCRFFIGSRTHAVISAYSTCVPTIALGYSVKSKGIAKDLGLQEKLVVDCKNVSIGNELIESFQFLLENEQILISHMKSIINNYKKLSFEVVGCINSILF